jgi:PH (Pleckstrin Homology) domain-containing protein/putative oligomerization/nucleic acid binding protein
MRYADSLLANGEVVHRRARQHWLALILDSRRAILFLILGLVALAAYLILGPQNQTVATVLGYLAAALIILALIFFAIEYWEWWAQDYLITNRRMIKAEGIINKRSADSSLEKINDALLRQDIFGRMFGYGDLDILTAAEGAIDHYRMLADAPGFKRAMLEAKHRLEMEMSYRVPPSPPFRATEAPSAPPPSRASESIVPPVSSARAAAPTGSSAAEITQTLARLADLRDRGAITAEEYEAKKDELLRRL